MKRIILTLITLFIFSFGYAQISVFHEDFEVVDSMTTSGNPLWFQQAGYFTSPTHCMRDTVAQGDSSYLTSNAFSTIGNSAITLSFKHICKISFADQATVEVSNNNGATWVQLRVSQYLSSSGFGANLDRFSSAVYGPGASGWHSNVDTMTPTNTWWKTESFNLSSLVPNAAQVKIRFKLKDGNNNGNSGNYGWLIDDVNVIAAPNELVSPYLAWSSYYQGNVFCNLGPYTITDTLYDLPTTGGCGLDTSSAANLFYTINGGPPVSLHMVNTGGNIFQATIPPINVGDTVCYYVQAHDTCNNGVLLPATGCISFIAQTGIVFPFLDNFDCVTNVWTPADSSAAGVGSDWQLGTPAFGVTNTAHSNPNAWDIDLATGYTDQANCMLYSPYFDFTNVYNPVLSFWRNHRVESGWDGVRLEYSLDSGATWSILGAFSDPNGTNWYTTAHINSSNTAAWDGATTGWVKSTYKLGCLYTGFNHVRFRFIFTSDFSVTQDGFSIDDFAIDIPGPNDVGVNFILQPGAVAPAGTVDSVRVVIANFGSQPASGFDISYTVNGGTPVTQVYSGILLPCDVDTVVFTTTLAAPTGSFGICAYTSYSGDTNLSNDTICKNSQGIPLLPVPYSDDFETPPAVWYDSSAIGTNWQLGAPAFGVTNSAHTPVNAWDVNLTTAYANSAHSVLFSPLFNMSGIYNPKASFWLNYKAEGGWDGTRLEYSLDAGTTWYVMGTVGDPNATNWYTDAQLNSSNLPAWEDTSGGWKKSTYRLGAIPGLNNNPIPVQFKFVFTSDFSIVQDGASMDDFAIDLAFPQDVGVSSILQPGVYSPSGVIDTVKVTVTNFGATAASNFNVTYTVNAVAVGTQLYAPTLQPGASDTVIFITPFTVPSGSYNLCAYTSLTGDGDNTNDTMCSTQHGIPSFTLPYFDSFDTSAVVWFDSSATPTTRWELGTPTFGQTTGSHTPPNCWDINLNSVYGLNTRCNLISPIFDFTGISNAKMTFWQNRNLQNFGDGVQLQYSTDGGNNWQQLGILSPDPLATNWYNATIGFPGIPVWSGMSVDSTTLNPGWIKSTYKLVPLNNQPSVIFKFLFNSGFFGAQDGISIDDFKIVPPTPQDASALTIIQPGTYAPSGASDTVRVIISNEGLNPISNFNVSYNINGVLTGTATYTGTLQPSIHDTIALPPFNAPIGAFDICAYTLLAGDGDLTNDTTCKSSFGIPLHTISHFDDFEGANEFITDSNDWEFGTPASSVIDSAYSPTHAWKTRLIGNYSLGDNDYLYSPFFDFSNAFHAVLRFRHWYLTNNNNDGGRVDYSSDGGSTWNILGFVGDPNGTNWYNVASINFSNLPGWQGNSQGYILSSYKMNMLNNYNANYVQFRFNFKSNMFGTTSNGWAIDNFEVYNPITVTASPVHIGGINNPFAISGPQTISAYVKNKGSFDITSVNATLVIDGVPIVTDPIAYSPALHSGDSLIHAFTAPWNPTLGGHDICVITSLPNGIADLDPSDDTTCTFAGEFDSVTVSSAVPYCNDFEPGNGHPSWIPLNAITYQLFDSDWKLGTPNKPVINTANSGANAWVTSVNESYSPKDSSGLFSPVFAVDSVGCYELSFLHNYQTELYQDGGVVEYSFNNGVSWLVLGYAYESDWYNSQYITGLVGSTPTAGWSGPSVGWVRAIHNLKFAYSTHVIFRFRFGSDYTNQQDGWAIDDVCFRKIGTCVIGIEEINANSVALSQNFPNPASNETYFTYSIPEHGKVSLYVTDVLGRKIKLLANGSKDAGQHQATLNVKELADGMYYCTLEFGNRKLVRKFVVAK